MSHYVSGTWPAAFYRQAAAGMPQAPQLGPLPESHNLHLQTAGTNLNGGTLYPLILMQLLQTYPRRGERSVN